MSTITLVSLLVLVPKFLTNYVHSTLAHNSDLTLSLFTRYWMQSIKSGSLTTFTWALDEILCTVSKTVPAPTPPIIQRILDGGDGTATTMLSRMSYYIGLVRFPDALPMLLFITSLYKQACRECHAVDSGYRVASRDFVREVEKCQVLWTTMLDLLERASLPENDTIGILVVELAGQR